MKKKKKSVSRKKSAAAKTKKNRLTNFKKRMDAEFATALVSAKTYVNDPARLRGLFDEAATEAGAMPREPFGEMWPYLYTMLRLIRAYSEGRY